MSGQLFSRLVMLKLFLHSNLALTYNSDMMQIFDNDYATLAPMFNVMQVYFSILDSDHASSLVY